MMELNKNITIPDAASVKNGGIPLDKILTIFPLIWDLSGLAR